MDCSPLVAKVPVDTVTPLFSAGLYESVAVERALACDATVTFHLWFAPTPDADVHVIPMLAVVTEQPVAL